MCVYGAVAVDIVPLLTLAHCVVCHGAGLAMWWLQSLETNISHHLTSPRLISLSSSSLLSLFPPFLRVPVLPLSSCPFSSLPLPISPPPREEGIPEMLDVDDMVRVKIPDSRSIMTFLVTIYQHFNS